jgi:hypothetical protein
MEAARSCSLYGLGVRVNVALAALERMPAPPRIDVDIVIDAGAPAEDDWTEYYASPERDARGVHHIHVSRGARGYRVAYEDGTRIYVEATGARVWAQSAPGATVEDTATYLLGPTLGFVLRLRGVTCLHASTVAMGDRALAIVAPSGFGKSTTAAAFAMRGRAVLSDDVAALSDMGERFAVWPAYPRIRLWPETVASFFGSEDALPRITPTWEKRFLALDGAGYRFQDAPLPLAGICLLADRHQQARQPRIERVEGHEAFMALVGNTYTTYLLDKPMRAREFELLGRLARNVPLCRAVPGAAFEQIDQLCDAIEATLDV